LRHGLAACCKRRGAEQPPSSSQAAVAPDSKTKYAAGTRPTVAVQQAGLDQGVDHPALTP
jgi:hypothetical protein